MASLRIVTRKEAGMHPVIFVVFSICVSHASPSLLKEEHCKLWLEVDSSALAKDAVTCIPLPPLSMLFTSFSQHYGAQWKDVSEQKREFCPCSRDTLILAKPISVF